MDIQIPPEIRRHLRLWNSDRRILGAVAFQASTADLDTVGTAPAIVTPCPIAARIGAHIDPFIGWAFVIRRIFRIVGGIGRVCRSYRFGRQSAADDTGGKAAEECAAIGGAGIGGGYGGSAAERQRDHAGRG